MRRAVIGLFAAVLTTGWVWSDTQESRPEKGTAIPELIKQLGSSKFAEREKAAKELEAIGEPALEALRGVVKGAETGQLDLETTRRAAEILRRLEEKISNAKILAPRRVRLSVKDASVLDAITELEKQSQYPVVVTGDRNVLASRKITLDTGDTTFWQAFDELCQKGGLVQPNVYSPLPGPVPPLKTQPPPNRQVQMLRSRVRPSYPAQSEQIQVTAGTPTRVPASYTGAVRVRAFLGAAAGLKGEAVVTLDALAEPRLQSFSLNSSPRIDRAIDDQGQALGFETEPAQFDAHAIHRQARFRVKFGNRSAQVLKELSGSFTAQALTPTETLVTVPDILKAAGKTAKGAANATLSIASVQKQPNGDVQLQVRMENIPGQNAFGANGVVIQQIQINVQGGGNVIIGGMPLNQGASMPALVDRDGKNFQLISIPSRRLQINNGQMSQELTLVFRPHAGQGEADRLLLAGQRTVTFQVPFSFKNVPLP